VQQLKRVRGECFPAEGELETREKEELAAGPKDRLFDRLQTRHRPFRQGMLPQGRPLGNRFR
jgi:hypothetical protein